MQPSGPSGPCPKRVGAAFTLRCVRCTRIHGEVFGGSSGTVVKWKCHKCETWNTVRTHTIGEAA